MTAAQQQLVVEPPTLTAQQRAVLAHIGLGAAATATDLGRIAHTVPGPRGGRTHSPDRSCDWCQKTGRRIANGLVDLGLVRRRKGDPGTGYVYVLAGSRSGPSLGADAGTGPGDLPEGF